MTVDDELRQKLIRAAADFPMRGRPLGLHQRVIRRRRVIAGVAAAVSVAAAIGVAAVIPLVGGSNPGPGGAAPPAYAVTEDYVGSSWLLIGVSDGATSTAIPADIGARMDLLSDGRLLADDGVNALSGSFTQSADGFEVRDVATSLVAYVGNDPQLLAAIAAIDTLAYGNRDAVTPPDPVQDTVISADGNRLVVQAGTLRLTFERIGPATTPAPPSPTETS